MSMYIDGQEVAPVVVVEGGGVPKISGYVTNDLVHDLQFRYFPSYDEILQDVLNTSALMASINLLNDYPCLDNASQTSGFVRVDDLPECKGITDFTVSIWHKKKASSIDSKLSSIVQAGMQNNNGKNPAIFTYTDGKLFFSAYYADILTDVVYPLNEWHNIAVTSDGTIVNIYFDGEVVNSSELSVAMGTNNYCKLSIGGAIDGGALSKGQYANLLIYNRSLSAEEVLQNYNATKGFFLNDEGDFYAPLEF